MNCLLVLFVISVAAKYVECKPTGGGNQLSEDELLQRLHKKFLDEWKQGGNIKLKSQLNQSHQAYCLAVNWFSCDFRS